MHLGRTVIRIDCDVSFLKEIKFVEYTFQFGR